jgi:hypothetical protein
MSQNKILLTNEDGTDRLSRNAGKELSLYVAFLTFKHETDRLPRNVGK